MYNTKKLALILAIQAEIDAMKTANSEVDFVIYSSGHFFEKAEELRELAHKHDHEL